MAARGLSAQSTETAALRLLAIACVIVFISGFFGLGVWQLIRRSEKLALIDRVEARVHAAPTAPPGPDTWDRMSASQDEYRHVRVSGYFLNEFETFVQAVTVEGPGYWVMTPLATDAGFTVLINRGFVPSERRDPKTRAAGQVTGHIEIVGLLRMSEPHGGFLRSNDPQRNRWYSRDVAAIAASRRLPVTAPYFIDADATPNRGGLPIGGLTVIQFANNHLVYALTWFALGIGLLGAIIFARKT